MKNSNVMPVNMDQLHESMITSSMDIDLQEAMYPLVYDVALRILTGGSVSDNERLCVRKWVENVEEYRLLILPCEQDAWFEMEYGEGDREKLKLVIDERKKDKAYRNKLKSFGLQIYVSEEELEALKIIDRASGPVPVSDNRVFLGYLRDYFEAKAKDRDSLFKTCQKIYQSLGCYEKTDFRGMVLAGIVRDYNYLENGPDDKLIQRLRRKYDRLSDQTPMYANLVVNYCYELGMLPKARDVMLLHTPATYGLTKRKFEDSFPRAELELENLFSEVNSRAEEGVIGEAVADAKKRNLRDCSRAFLPIRPWYIGKKWFFDLYEKRMYVWALQWPHGKIEQANKLLS